MEHNSDETQQHALPQVQGSANNQHINQYQSIKWSDTGIYFEFQCLSTAPNLYSKA